MKNNNQKNIESYNAWLSTHNPVNQLPELYFCYTEIEKHGKKMRILKEALLDTTDLSILARLRSDIEKNRLFRFRHKKQMKTMKQAMTLYINFVKGLSVVNGESSKHNANKQTNIDTTEKNTDTEMMRIAVKGKYKGTQTKKEIVSDNDTDQTSDPYGSISKIIIDVLKDELFLTAKETVNLIIKKGLYSFSSPKSKSMVGSALNYHCKYSDNIPTYKTLLFGYHDLPNGERKYYLLEREAEVLELLSHLKEKNVIAEEPSKLTIRKAIYLVLSNNLLLTSNEIYERIIADNLYQFGAQNPKRVVEVTLGASCRDTPYKNKTKVLDFGCVIWKDEKKQYFLLSREKEVQALLDRDSETVENKQVLSYFSKVKEQYPELEFTNVNARGIEQNRAVYIYLKNYPRRGHVLFEIWQLDDETKYDLYIKRSLLTDAEYAESVKERKKTTGVRGRITRQWYNSDEMISFLLPKFEKAKGISFDTESEEEIKRTTISSNQSTSKKIKIASTQTPQKKSEKGVSIDQAEKYIKDSGLNGATVQEIIDHVQPGAAVFPTKNALNECSRVILMPGDRYVHVDSFVDLEEAEEEMERILKTHFFQFGGYSNNKLLFGAASHEMSLFLNDNDCESIDSVYALAQYFFAKKRNENAYTFSYPHIFDKMPDYPLTLKGLMINLARMNGGVLDSEEAKYYLQKTILSYGSIVQLLQISSSDTFLYYDEKRFLLTESIGINKSFIQSIHDRLDDLFRQANVAYVIPRDITVSWLYTLPALSQNLPWTILLLQEMLRNFPDIGFRSITSELGQASNTIAAAFVPVNSPLQSFSDVVTLYMQDKYPLPKRMTCEELRRELREAGMLEGNELIYALPKALNDYRFNWTDENKMVLVRGS